MKRHRLFALMLVALGQMTLCLASTLTPADMYIDPDALPSGTYEFEQQPTGYTVPFTDVQRLQVLPMLAADGQTYYYTPGVDYSGDITGTNGSITFHSPGPYHVLTTSTDGSTQIRDFSIDCDWHEPTVTGSRKSVNIPKPDGGDVVVVNQSRLNVPYTSDAYTGNPKVEKSLNTWADVTTFLKKQNGKHVELQGHGKPGKFYWNGVCVLNEADPGFQPWLDELKKAGLKKLTFISCSVGGGDAGKRFVDTVYSTLGGAGAYTKEVSCVKKGSEYIWSSLEGWRYLPEPASLSLLLVGGAGMLRRRAA